MDVFNSLVICVVCRARPYQAPIAGPKMADGLGDLCAIVRKKNVSAGKGEEILKEGGEMIG